MKNAFFLKLIGGILAFDIIVVLLFIYFYPLKCSGKFCNDFIAFMNPLATISVGIIATYIAYVATTIEMRREQPIILCRYKENAANITICMENTSAHTAYNFKAIYVLKGSSNNKKVQKIETHHILNGGESAEYSFTPTLESKDTLKFGQPSDIEKLWLEYENNAGLSFKTNKYISPS